MTNPAITHTTANQQKLQRLVAKARSQWNEVVTLDPHDQAAWDNWSARSVETAQEMAALVSTNDPDTP